jgi:oligopeptide/dipeptide ABC transporter ATP-binding protein
LENVYNKEHPPLLSVRDLVVEYTSGEKVIHAVNGISFDVERCTTLGLVGETGAGKTTIAKSILRILPDPPAKVRSGRICFEGKDVMQMPDAELLDLRGRRISMIFQDPMTALNPIMRVGSQIAEVIKLHNRVTRQEAERRAVQILETVGIPEDRFREYPHQFSGGMKQRVVIAIALACNPDLLLSDEPTTALDVTIQAQVLELIKKLKTEKGMSMILISHNLGVVAETCDDVAVLYAGEIIEYGNRDEVFDRANHPYTLGLFGALPDIKSDAERLSPIEGLPPDPSNLPKGCKFNPRCPYVMEDCRQDSVEMVHLGGRHRCRCRHTDLVAATRKG